MNQNDHVVGRLDEDGFEFHDEYGRGYKCCLWGGDPWLFYWSKSGNWVSYKKISDMEVSMYYKRSQEEM